MFKSYVVTALRSLLRHKSYSIVNTIGWAVGMACCLLMALYVSHEYAYDRFYGNADRIYRIVTDITTVDDVQQLATSSGAIAPAVRTDLPEVMEIVRLRESSLMLEQGRDRYQKTIYFADSTFFDVFDFPLRLGQRESALREPASIVLTADAALKYFGESNPIGQVLTLDSEHELTVTGVLAALPDSSHLAFDALVSMATGEAAIFQGELENWGVSRFYTYFLLQEGTSNTGLDAKLEALVESRIGPLMRDINVYIALSVEPLTSIYLQSERALQIGATGSALNVYAFATVGFFILLISSLNVVNLTVARLAERVSEVGVRKALGASNRQLITQFIGESVLLALIGSSLALLLAAASLPGFNLLSGATLTTAVLFQVDVLILFVLTSALVGVLAGLYPAVLFARSQSTHVLRGSIAALSPRRNAYRGLVILQFSLAAALMACTTVVYHQLQYMKQVELGFEPAQTLIVDYQGAKGMSQGLETLKAELLRYPGIESVSASSHVPGEQVQRTSINPQRAEGTPNEVRQVIDYRVDYAFLEQYDISLLAGRVFSQAHRTDATHATIINEAMMRALGFEKPSNALGTKINVSELNAPQGSTGIAEVIGVTRDFHVRSMHDTVEPLLMRIDPATYRFLSIRIAKGGIRNALPEIKRIASEVVPESALTYRFLDDRFDEQYRADVQFGRTFAAAALLALFLGCLGLNGLSANAALRRRKEIGIRKTFGASSGTIVGLLSKDFLALVSIALFVALPLAYVLMTQWLADFAYRIELGPGLFLVVGVSAFAIACLAVSYQAISAALADPIRSLRHR